MNKTNLFTTSLLIGAIAFSSNLAIAEDTVKNEKPTAPVAGEFQKRPPANVKKIDFDKRLKLTDEQKKQAKDIRMKGHEQLKPVMKKTKAINDELFALKKNTTITEQEKRAQFHKLMKEKHILKRQAHEIKRANMYEFESILTKKQKKELDKIKQEGRKEFEKNFKAKKNKECNCDCNKKGPRSEFHKHRPFPPFFDEEHKPMTLPLVNDEYPVPEK